MFLLQNSRRKCIPRIFVEYRDSALQHDHSMVHNLVDKVHRTSGYLGSILERLVLRVQSGKRGQK